MSFAEIYTNKLFGAIHGFDRLRFRGTIREISTASGFTKVLNFLHVLMTNFKVFLMSITRNMVSSALRYCKANCIQYAWQPGSMDKDAVAKQVLATFPEGYTGPVFCLATIEGCQTFKLFSNPVTKKLEPRMETGKGADRRFRGKTSAGADFPRGKRVRDCFPLMPFFLP